MADPLDGYTPDWRTRQDPLAGYTPDWRTKASEGFETAVGRRSMEFESQSRQLEQYRASLATATGERKARLERQIETLEKEMNMLGTAGSLGESVKRFAGGVAGAIPQLGMGLIDVGLAGGELAQKVPFVPDIVPFTKGREVIHEAMTGLDEITGARGVEGIVGSFVGTLGAGALKAGTTALRGTGLATRLAVSPNMVPRIATGALKTIDKGLELVLLPATAFGQMSQATLRFLGKASLLQPAARAGLEGTRLQRVAGSILGDLPINSFQALTIPGANAFDVARSLALGTAGSTVGGFFTGRVSFDNPSGKPFDADLSNPTKGTAAPEMVKLADEVDRINEWSRLNPDKSYADLTPEQQAAIRGTEEPSAPLTQIVDHGKILSEYLVGTHDDFEAAQRAFRLLAENNLAGEAIASVMGMKTQVVEGHVAMVDTKGMVPNPERLLVASGEAPRPLMAAAKAQSDSKLNQPEMEFDAETGQVIFNWELKDGNHLWVQGHKIGDVFRIEWIGNGGGPKALNARIIMNARRQLLELTGATDVSGYRIGGARPDREAGAPLPEPQVDVEYIRGLADDVFIDEWTASRGRDREQFDSVATERGLLDPMPEAGSAMIPRPDVSRGPGDVSRVGVESDTPPTDPNALESSAPLTNVEDEIGMLGVRIKDMTDNMILSDIGAIITKVDPVDMKPRDLRYARVYMDALAGRGIEPDQLEAALVRYGSEWNEDIDLLASRANLLVSRIAGPRGRVQSNTVDSTPIDLVAAKAEWNAIQDRVDTGDASPAEIQRGFELYEEIEAAGGWAVEDYLDTPSTPASDLATTRAPAEPLKLTKITSALTPKEADILSWAMDPVNEYFHSGEIDTRPDLVGKDVAIGNLRRGEFYLLNDKDVIDDLAYRIEDQYMSMAVDQHGDPQTSADPNTRRMLAAEQRAVDSLMRKLRADLSARTEPPLPTRSPANTPPETPTARTTPDPTPRLPDLETLTVPKPLEQFSADELTRLMDKVYLPYDRDPRLMQTEGYRAAQRDAAKINKALQEIEKRPIESQYALERDVDAVKLADLLVKPLTKMKESELTELNVMLQAKIAQSEAGAVKDAMVDRLLDLRAHQRSKEVGSTKRSPKELLDDTEEALKQAELERKKAFNTAGHSLSSTLATITSTAGGFLIGNAYSPDDTDAERMRRATIWALALGGTTAGAFALKGRMSAQFLQRRNKIPGEAELDAVMTSSTREAAGTPDRQVAITMGAVERFYKNTLRPSRYGERVARLLAGGAEIGKQVGDMLATFGMFHRTTVEWMFTGPKKLDPLTGQWTPLTTIRGDGVEVPIKSMGQILRETDGNIDMLGKTSMALSAIELFTRTGRTPHPKLQPAQLSQFIRDVDKKFIQAAQDMRDLHLGLLDMQLNVGLITPEARAAMASEKYYTALERVFGSASDAVKTGDIAKKIKGIFSPQPVKSRDAPNEYDIRNPVETLMFNIPRVAKAVELQEKKGALISLWEASNIPKEVKESLLRPVSLTQKERDAMVGNNEKIKLLKEYLPKLSDDDALNMIAAFDNTPLGPNSEFMTYIRNGKREVWRLAPDLTDTFRYMQGHEIGKFFEWVGATSDVARAGVGFSPDFIARMAWFDVFQTYMNSKHGSSLRDMIPGVNWVAAFRQAWQKSPEYKLFSGGTAEGTMFEGLRSPAEIVRRAQAQGDTYTADLWKDVKGLHPIDAYKTLLVPFAEAGRFSEFLADRRHGKSVHEALRSATAVNGYYNQVGQYAAAMFRMVPFLKGTAQSLDQAFAASGMHPFREYDTPNQYRIPGTKVKWGDTRRSMMWMAKGFTAIAIPTAILYAANDGDEEIEQLRQSTNGRRFYFMRSPTGGIISVRKAAGPEGALFSTGLEIALDAWRGREPEPFKEWVGAMRREMTLPWLPPIASVGMTALTGVDMSFGSPLISAQATRLPVDQQARANTTEAARTASAGIVQTLGEPKWDWLRRSVSPAGIEHIVRTMGGTLAGESLRLADMSRAWVEHKSIPAAQEWPIIRKFVTLDMTRQQTRAMEDFYDAVAEAERVANGLSKSLADRDIEGYIALSERNAGKLAAHQMLLDTRTEIVDFTRAIEEMKSFDGDPAYKRQMILHFRKQVQMMMQQTMETVRAIQN